MARIDEHHNSHAISNHDSWKDYHVSQSVCISKKPHQRGDSDDDHSHYLDPKQENMTLPTRRRLPHAKKESVILIDVNSDGTIEPQVIFSSSEMSWQSDRGTEKFETANNFRHKLRDHTSKLSTRLVFCHSLYSPVIQDIIGLEYGLPFELFEEFDVTSRKTMPFIRFSDESRVLMVQRACGTIDVHNLHVGLVIFVLEEVRYEADSCPLSWEETIAQFSCLSREKHRYVEEYEIRNTVYKSLNIAMICRDIIQSWGIEKIVDANKNPVAFICPLMDWKYAFLYVLCRTDRKLLQDSWQKDDDWQLTIKRLHFADTNEDQFRRYVRVFKKSDTFEVDSFFSIDHDFVRRTAEQLSLLRKATSEHELALASVEEAKLAFEEGRRVKLITILAFMFIPISLSTSIFGMNVQELNDNGQPIWIFFATTVLILAIALLIWAISYQWSLFTQADYDADGKVVEYSWFNILQCLGQLLRHGHFVFAWRSNILVSLFTNGKSAFQPSCKSDEVDDCVVILALRKHGSTILPDHFHSAFHPYEYVYSHTKAASVLSSEERACRIDAFASPWKLTRDEVDAQPQTVLGTQR